MQLALLVVAAPVLVQVPQSGSGPECAARVRIAAAVDASPGLRLARTATAAAPAPASGWWLDGRIDADGAEVRRVGSDGAGRTARGPDLSRALAAVWPKAGAPLAELEAAGMPSPAALDRLCAGEVEAAYAEAGDAAPPGWADVAPPPDAARRGTLLPAWGWARAGRATPAGCRAGLGVLRRTVTALEQGALPPLWRHEADDVGEIFAWPDVVVRFVSGAWVGLDPGTGRPRWRRAASRGVPTPVRLEGLDEARLALVDADGLTVVDVKSGAVAWQLASREVAPEVAVSRTRVVVGTREAVVGLDRRTGAEAWRYDGLSSPSSGPVAVEDMVVAPLYSRVAVLDAETGVLRRAVELGDEIAGPLQVGADGGIWAPVGAQEVLRVDPIRGQITFRTQDAYALDWPPAHVGTKLAARVVPRRRRPALLVLDPDAATAKASPLYGLEVPLVSLGDFTSFAHATRRPAQVVARTLDGKVRWAARQRGAVTDLRAARDLVVVAAGRDVTLYDRQQGKALWRASLSADVVQAVYGRWGGAALVADGSLYGLPEAGDLRVRQALERARLDVMTCYDALDVRSRAVAAAKTVLERHPGQLDAAHLLARRASRTEAIAGWLGLLEAAPVGAPEAIAARAALAEAGIAGVLRPDAKIARLLSIDADAVTAEADRGRVALDLVTGAINAADAADAAGPAPVRGPSAPLAVEGDLEVRTGTTAEAPLVVTRGDAVAWTKDLGAPARRAWLKPTLLLVATDDRLFGFAPATGARRFRRALSASAQVSMHTQGFLLRTGARVLGYDDRGRYRYTARIGADERLAVADDALLVYGEDGVETYTLDRGRRRSRHAGLDVRDLTATDERGAMLLDDGRVLVFDPAGL